MHKQTQSEPIAHRCSCINNYRLLQAYTNHCLMNFATRHKIWRWSQSHRPSVLQHRSQKKLWSVLQPITVSWAEEWKNLIKRLHDLSCLIEICDVIERLCGSVVAIASSFDARSPSAMCCWWLNWNIIVVVTICLSIDLDSIIWFWFVIGGSRGLCVLWAVFNEARKWLVWLL